MPGFFDIFPTFYEAPLAWVLLALIVPVSIIAFYYKPLYHALLFHPYEVYRGKRSHTLFTSAFIHKGWWHLFWNMVIVFGLSYDMFGVIRQEYEGTLPYVFSLLLTLLFLLIPNLFVGWKARSDITFTSLGASGLTYGLIGFCVMFYPLQEMSDSWLIPMNRSYQYWIVLLIIFSAFLLRKNKINHSLHLFAYMQGTISAIILRPTALIETAEHIINWT